MPDLVSLDKLLYDNNIEVDGRNRARIIRRCQELGRGVYLDFGRSSELDCVIGVWNDKDGNRLTEKFGTPNTPCQIFEEDLESLASAVEQGDLVTALKNIHCYLRGFVNIMFSIFSVLNTLCSKGLYTDS